MSGLFPRACRPRAASPFLAVLAATLAACTTAPPAPVSPAFPVAWQPSPNFDGRRPNLVVLHHTSNDNIGRALQTLTSPGTKVSAHYLVGRDGRIIQLVDERDRAWHAGVSYWGGQTDLNSASIGIEMDNTGREPYPEEQVAALLRLLADLKARYGIPTANFVGHADVAPGRKTDPSPFFPWARLARSGFGLWCDEPYPPAPPGFDLATGIQALGYNPANPASLQAFRDHFLPAPGPMEVSFETSKILDALACLAGKKALLP